MTWLSLLLAVKIVVTATTVVVPFLVLSPARLAALTDAAPSAPGLYRLYGVALLALLVAYGSGIAASEVGVFPHGVVLMGIVSNAGATAVVLAFGARGLSRTLAVFFGTVAALLLLFLLVPSLAAARAW